MDEKQWTSSLSVDEIIHSATLVSLKANAEYRLVKGIWKAMGKPKEDMLFKKVKSQLVEINERALIQEDLNIKETLLELDELAEEVISWSKQSGVTINPSHLLELGTLFYTEGKYRLADRYMQKILKDHPSNKEALLRWLELLILQEDIAQAEKVYTKLAKTENTLIFEWLIGSSLDNLRKYEGLLKLFDKLIEEGDSDKELEVNRCCVLVRLGEAQRGPKFRLIDTALGILENLEASMKNEVIYWNTLAFARLKRGNYENGIKAAKKAIGIQEDNTAARCIMGDCYRGQGSLKEAIKCYGSLDVLASDCYPKCCKILMKQACVLERIGCVPEAIELYARLASRTVCTPRDVALVTLARKHLKDMQEFSNINQTFATSNEELHTKQRVPDSICVVLVGVVFVEGAIGLCVVFSVGLASFVITTTGSALGICIALLLALKKKKEQVARVLTSVRTICVLIILATILPIFIGAGIVYNNYVDKIVNDTSKTTMSISGEPNDGG